MKYSWAVWHINPTTGLPDDQRSRGLAGYTEASSPEDLVQQLGITLAAGERLLVWDTVGVGNLPVLTVDGEG